MPLVNPHLIPNRRTPKNVHIQIMDSDLQLVFKIKNVSFVLSYTRERETVMMMLERTN